MTDFAEPIVAATLVAIAATISIRGLFHPRQGRKPGDVADSEFEGPAVEDGSPSLPGERYFTLTE